MNHFNVCSGVFLFSVDDRLRGRGKRFGNGDMEKRFHEALHLDEIIIRGVERGDFGFGDALIFPRRTLERVNVSEIVGEINRPPEFRHDGEIAGELSSSTSSSTYSPRL